MENLKLPTYYGQIMRAILVRDYGLPNSAPYPEELWLWGALAYIKTRRVLFVDDFRDGEPRAFWAPEDKPMRLVPLSDQDARVALLARAKQRDTERKGEAPKCQDCGVESSWKRLGYLDGKPVFACQDCAGGA